MLLGIGVRDKAQSKLVRIRLRGGDDHIDYEGDDDDDDDEDGDIDNTWRIYREIIPSDMKLSYRDSVQR